MKRRVVRSKGACTVCVFLSLLSSLCLAGAYSGGDGLSEATAWRISKVADWVELTNTPADWTGRHFRLTADIDLSGLTILPVGSFSTPFSGILDGNGHAINAQIQQSVVTHTALFHSLNHGGQIRNLTANVLVTGNIYVAGLVAANRGTITSCNVTGHVIGLSRAGGVAAVNESTGAIVDCSANVTVIGTAPYVEPSALGVGGVVAVNVGTLKNCRANSNVSATYHVGGLAGLNYGEVTSCHAAGVVSATMEYVGGLAAFNDGAIRECSATTAVYGTANFAGGLVGSNCETITSCYATGAVNGNFEVGGLVGINNGVLTACYATGAATGYTYVGGLLGLNTESTQYIVTHCYSTGKVTRTYSNGNRGGLCGGNWACEYPADIGNFWDTETSEIMSSAMGQGKTTAEMKTQSTFTAPGVQWDFETVWFMPDNGYPRFQWDKYSGGNGLPATPFQIACLDDFFIMMAAPEDWDKHFILTADLDLAGHSFKNAPIAPDTNKSIAGFQGTVFCGQFDGAGRVIRNLTIREKAPWDYVGLFGFVGETLPRGKAGLIKNLGLENVSVRGRHYVAALVGKNHHGTVAGCYATGEVDALGSHAGGLVGHHGPGTLDLWASALTDSFSRCTVDGDTAVGGLIGTNHRSEVTHCYSTGAPTGTSNVGGLCGAATTGAGYEDNANFWDIMTSQTEDSRMGLGLKTRPMKTRATFTGGNWNFDKVWTICELTNYPRLQWQIPAADWACPDGIGLEDLAHFAAWWLATDCAESKHCEGTDLNASDNVDLQDYANFAAQYQNAVDP
ncbi:MAG: hypothetical protein IH624_16970 [Phycisphaerae bacterium]|nr:hypothetical protein [Phycisphaerae bacterium]